MVCLFSVNKTSVMKTAVGPHSSVVSLFTLTILMNISENTRVIVVKWCQRTSPGRSINYVQLCNGNHLPSREDVMRLQSTATLPAFLCRIVLTSLANEATFTRQCCHQKQQSAFFWFCFSNAVSAEQCVFTRLHNSS